MDKRVPIGIIGAIICQTLVFVYIGTAWKTDIESRVITLEKADQNLASHETRIVVLEQAVLRIRDDLSEIKALIRAQKTGRADQLNNLTPTSGTTSE